MVGTPAKDIAMSPERLDRAVRSLSVSTSPTATFHSPSSFGGGQLSRTSTHAKQLKPFDKTDMKILLLENVNQSGKGLLSGQNYQVESVKSSLPEDQLIEKIR
jgi:D-3-phosphoglycerate dehydrogenase